MTDDRRPEDKTLAKYLTGPDGERAQQALDRYQAFYDAAFGDSKDYNVGRRRLEVLGPPVRREEVTALEERLGVRMPTAWTDHVTKHGFFNLAGVSFGPLDQVGSLEALFARGMRCEPDEVSEMLEIDAEVLKGSICFSSYDSEFVCFRFDAKTDEDQDPPIATLYHDDREAFADEHSAMSFDEYVSKSVDETIANVVSAFKLPV